MPLTGAWEINHLIRIYPRTRTRTITHPCSVSYIHTGIALALDEHFRTSAFAGEHNVMTNKVQVYGSVLMAGDGTQVSPVQWPCVFVMSIQSSRPKRTLFSTLRRNFCFIYRSDERKSNLCQIQPLDHFQFNASRFTLGIPNAKLPDL